MSNKLQDLRNEWTQNGAPYNRNSDEDTATWWLSKFQEHLQRVREETLKEVKELLPLEKDGWTNFGCRTLNDYEIGHNTCLEQIEKSLASLSTKEESHE